MPYSETVEDVDNDMHVCIDIYGKKMPYSETVEDVDNDMHI